MKIFLRILIIVFISVSTSSITKSAEYNSVCAVFKNNQLVERNSCNARTLSNDNRADFKPYIREYKWKSGGKTITSNIEEFFQINGHDGETVFTKEGYDLCVRNFSSGNTYCVGER